MADGLPTTFATPIDVPEPTKKGVQEKQSTKELFEEDYTVYADRGPECIDWNDPAG